MKICILILSTNSKAYDCFKYAIRKTWLSDFKKKSIDCFFYEGDSEIDQIIDDTIYLSVKDEIKFTFLKFYKCLYFLKSINKEYDLYFRANLSCYIDIIEFFRFINHFKINRNSYCGTLTSTYLMAELTLKYKLLRIFKDNFRIGKKINFYSGAGFFIGRNNVDYILKYGNIFKNDLIVDDVLIGLILASKTYSTPQNNIMTILEIKFELNFKLSENELSKFYENHLFFYRFKNHDRIKDCEYLIKFGNPYIRKKILLNGFDKNEIIFNSKEEILGVDLFTSVLYIFKSKTLLSFIKLIISYLKILFLIEIINKKKNDSNNSLLRLANLLLLQ
jgi:hypothetical protein